MSLPRYDDLPQIPDLKVRHAWGVFGPGDELGTLNLLTAERRAAAARLVRSGRSISLVLPLGEPDPPLLGRRLYDHTIYQLVPNVLDDKLDGFYLQSSSHWDSFRHMRCAEHGYYGGITEDFTSSSGPLGIERWAPHGFAGRGVLIDVAGHFRAGNRFYSPFDPLKIGPREVADMAAMQGVVIGPGTILCFRFGWSEAYRALARSEREEQAKSRQWAGLSGADEMARYLWDAGVAAVAADNPGAEVAPQVPEDGSLHRRLLPTLGMVLGELFDFAELAEACTAEGRYEFFLASMPLRLQGGVGSPANAMAIL